MGKLSSKSEGHWVGYNDDIQGHWVYLPGKCCISTEGNVIIDSNSVEIPMDVQTEGRKAQMSIKNSWAYTIIYPIWKLFCPLI